MAIVFFICNYIFSRVFISTRSDFFASLIKNIPGFLQKHIFVIVLYVLNISWLLNFYFLYMNTKYIFIHIFVTLN